MLDVKHKSSYIVGMSNLPIKTRVQILSMLVEGKRLFTAAVEVCCGGGGGEVKHTVQTTDR